MIKNILIALALIWTNTGLAHSGNKIVEFELVQELPTCHQGPASALQSGMNYIMRDAAETCGTVHNGFLQFTKPEDIEIDLSQSQTPCGVVTIQITFQCARIPK